MQPTHPKYIRRDEALVRPSSGGFCTLVLFCKCGSWIWQLVRRGEGPVPKIDTQPSPTPAAPTPPAPPGAPAPPAPPAPLANPANPVQNPDLASNHKLCAGKAGVSICSENLIFS